MSRRGLLLLWGALAALAWTVPGWLPRSGAREPGMPERSPRTLHYEIDARLDVDEHAIDCTGRLTWRNDASTPATEMRFHLYLNAFRDRESTFMRESYGSGRDDRFDESNPGGVDLVRLERDGRNLLPGATYTPKRSNDRTVLVVPLEKPIAPGEEATFDLAWTSRLPKVVARSGFGGPFHMAAQWYPKPGVFAVHGTGLEGAWNCHPYHARSEFFADYGVYRVRIRVPGIYAGRVGATGKVVDPEGERHEDGSVTYEFVAEDVHDFAWVCDDDFVVKEYAFEGGDGTAPEERERMRNILGRDPGPLPPVTVRLLLQPEHEHLAERHRVAVFHALSMMGHWFGAYPYPVLTVVDPDHRARGAGGMEYPTLITAGTGYVQADDGWSPEFVTVHEFGHQHFYGLIGTNEFEDAWMDEGLTTWATARVMMRAYGKLPPTTRYADLPVAGERPLEFGGWLDAAPNAAPWAVILLRDQVDLPLIGGLWPDHGSATPLSFLREVPPLTLLRPLPIDVAEHERTRLASRDLVDPVIGRKAWHHMDGRSYGVNSYRRTAAVLRTIEARYGERRMLRFVRAYCERYRFRHPVPEDVFLQWEDTVEGGDLRPLLGDLFDGMDHVDYAVAEIRDLGDDAADGQEVILRRHGLATKLPIEILIRFDDGTNRRFVWHPDDTVTPFGGRDAPVHRAPSIFRAVDPEKRAQQGRWRGLTFVPGPQEPRRVVSAEVDPRRRIFLDRDRTNDGRRVETGVQPSLNVALRFLGWVEMNTSFYGGL